MKPIITNNRRNSDEENDENTTQQALSKFLPYWPLFILASLLALAGAYVYLRYATPIYESSATMLVKDADKGAKQSAINNEINKTGSQIKVENELEVLQSRILMEKVVKRLALYAPITQMGKVKAVDAYLLSPIKIEVQNPDSIKGADKVFFSYDKKNQTVTLNDNDKYPINEFVTTPYGDLKFTVNKYYSPSFETDKKMYFSLEDPSVFASAISHGLKVSSNRQSAIINMSYRDPIPQRAVDVLNELLKSYQETSIEEETKVAKGTLAYLNERLAIMQKSMDSVSGKIKTFKSSKSIVNNAEQASVAIQNQAITDQAIGALKQKEASLAAIERSIASSVGTDAEAPKGVNDPALAGMMAQLYAAKMEYNRMKNEYGETHPALLAKAAEINRLRPGILENIRSQRTAVNAEIASLGKTSGSYRAVMSAAPGNDAALDAITREQFTQTASYNDLAQMKQQAEMSILAIEPKTKVVDKPLLSDTPVSPKKKLIYIMAIMAALGSCIGIITLKDAFTGKIKYRAEIEKMTGIPIIGEIAFDKSKNPLVIEKGTRSFVAEEFRKLRISLSFLGIDSSHKKLLVTSSISGEGKSFIAANLAVSISLTGKKVVLVDMDLNNPSLSKILNVNQEYGTTELLNGEKRADEVIKKLDEHENLWFISAGNLPENPTELLANGKVNAIIDYLENNFDMVVIDTSPSVLVTDAFILSGLCDATLYVIRHDYTPKMLVKRIDENNEINPLHNPAIVFNGVKSRGIIKNNYGYGYDYVYGNKERGTKTKKVS